MESSRDIVIVGGGPAGLTTALALAAAAPEIAPRIAVLEKARYPRDKPCAGAIGGRGVKLLAELGAVPDVPSVAIDGVSFRGRTGDAEARVGGIGRVVRRIEFDAALAQIARSRGVAVEDGMKVEAVVDDVASASYGGGATVRTSTGERRACVVVGADGVGSAVRRSMGLSAGTLRAQVLELDTEVLPSDGPRSVIHFDASDPGVTGYAWDFPTLVDGEPMVCRGVYVLKTGGADVDLGAWLGRRLASMGLDIAHYDNKRYAERGYDPVERVALGRRMLVGEAAGIDPITGEGIAQAIEYGVLAGRFLAAALARDPARPDVSGWSRRLRRSRLAWDLRARELCVRLFYGPARDTLERFLLAHPDSLHLGCQHFAAQAYDPARFAHFGLEVAGFLARRQATRLASRVARGAAGA